jgi:hypothetical protein
MHTLENTQTEGMMTANGLTKHALDRALGMSPAQRRRFLWLVRRAAMHPSRRAWLRENFGDEVDGAGIVAWGN